MPTISLPKATTAKRVWVQVSEVLPVGKSLAMAVGIGFSTGDGASEAGNWEVVRFVGRSEMGSKSEHSKKANEIGRGSKDENDAFVFRTIHRWQGAMVRQVRQSTLLLLAIFSFSLPVQRFRPIQSHNSV
jgi:hypothetical protein